MLELLDFLRGGCAGHDFNQRLAGLAIQQSANHKTVRDSIPYQFSGIVRTLGKSVGVNIKQYQNPNAVNK